ncbi:Aminotransferase class-III [Clostridium acidisoli DSM 12555]|uniref:Aminotransferase class-III n=1 Tax=Clostridium acidisoli DSM 12555 TaxID=1121291 RepID=A0A1W1XU51_9CLOT|nr:Aminotransferase class-III [Clostridium acidisoli DSM 12555]
MKKLKTLPHTKEVRGKGLLVGVEFDAPVGKNIKHGCFDRKLLVTLIGTSVIRMVPSLIVTKEDCDKAYEILKSAVEEAYN